MENLKYTYQKLNISLNDIISNRRIPLSGQRITHNEGSQKVTIKLHSNSNDEIDIQPQGSIIVPDGFNIFYLSADASAGNDIELIVSSPSNLEFDNKSLTIDTIDTITLLQKDESSYFEGLNSENSFRLSEGLFCSSTFRIMAVGLYNPIGSGYNLIIDKIQYSYRSSLIDTCLISHFADYSTLYTTMSSLGKGKNKFINKSDGVGEGYWHTTNTFVPDIESVLCAPRLEGNNKGKVDILENSIVAPGCMIGCKIANSDIFTTLANFTVGFSWKEVAI